jgi:hypothetical protein
MMEKEEEEEEEEEETSLYLPVSQTALKAAGQILVLRVGLGGCGQWAASGELSHTGLRAKGGEVVVLMHRAIVPREMTTNALGSEGVEQQWCHHHRQLHRQLHQ